MHLQLSCLNVGIAFINQPESSLKFVIAYINLKIAFTYLQESSLHFELAFKNLPESSMNFLTALIDQ